MAATAAAEEEDAATATAASLLSRSDELGRRCVLVVSFSSARCGCIVGGGAACTLKLSIALTQLLADTDMEIAKATSKRSTRSAQSAIVREPVPAAAKRERRSLVAPGSHMPVRSGLHR